MRRRRGEGRKREREIGGIDGVRERERERERIRQKESAWNCKAHLGR